MTKNVIVGRVPGTNQVQRVPCAGCGQSHPEGRPDLPKALADGYCLTCRLAEKHVGRPDPRCR